MYVSKCSSRATPVEATRDGTEKGMHGSVERAPALTQLGVQSTRRIFHHVGNAGVLAGRYKESVCFNVKYPASCKGQNFAERQ